jgi:ATP-dependent exoDNAse (exonuclease V) beta subunit
MAELAREGRSDREDAAGARWVFPALARAETEPELGAGPPPPDAGAVRAAARVLEARRAEARARSARAYGAPASGAAHEALESALEARAGREEGERADASGGWDAPAGSSGRRALAVGSAVHAALESFDFEAEPRAELARGRERSLVVLRERLAPEDLAAAAEHASRLLERFAAGPLLARLRVLSRGILARELPVLLPAEPGSPAAAGSGPVGFLAGAVDLLYRDPESGELVVADYKTDRIASEAELADRRSAYAEQGRVYQRALREALELEADPRFELWFLESGRIERP